MVLLLRRQLQLRRPTVALVVSAALLVAGAVVVKLRLPRTVPRPMLLARPLPTRWNLTCPEQTEVEVATTESVGVAKGPSLERFVGCAQRRRWWRRRRRRWRRWGAGYWVLRDWLPAQRQPVCLRAVTLTTHADLTYMPNLGLLVRRWQAPVSLALYAPGDDLEPTLRSILWARACIEPPLVVHHVSFHLLIDSEHMPRRLPPPPDLSTLEGGEPPDCSPETAPWLQVAAAGTYRWRHGLPYPINALRNVARAAARTHFLLPSDVELLPSTGLSSAFLAMLRRQPHLVSPRARSVFVLPVFEVGLGVQPPENKSQLVSLLRSGDAAQFHEKPCLHCQLIPFPQHWVCAPQRPAGDLDVFTVTKIHPRTCSWEPIYIGTNREPPYDERLSWEGMREKIVQIYIMCLLGYEFHVLDNAFLVHQPGVKRVNFEDWRRPFRIKNNALIKKTIKPEIRKLFGDKKNCWL